MLARKIPFRLHYLSILNCQLERCSPRKLFKALRLLPQHVQEICFTNEEMRAINDSFFRCARSRIEREDNLVIKLFKRYFDVSYMPSNRKCVNVENYGHVLTTFHNPSLPTQIITKTPPVALALLPSRTRHFIRHIPSLLKCNETIQLQWKLVWKHILPFLCNEQRHEPALYKTTREKNKPHIMLFQM